MKKGFTLIELLVVVLIIGILSSVALPQYTKAVEKARAAEAWTTAKSFIDAQKIYHMNNGKWATDMEELDIEIPEMKNWELTISGATNVPGNTQLYFYLTGKNLMNALQIQYNVPPNGRILVQGSDEKPHIYPCKMEYMSSMGGSPGCYL